MEEEHFDDVRSPPNDSSSPSYIQKNCAAFSPFVLLLSLVAGLGGFLFGYDTGVISGALLFIQEDFDITEDDTWKSEVIVSGTVAGAIFGAMGAGMVNDWIGRKKTIMVACVVFTLGALIMGLSPTISVLVVGRVIAGLGVGIASMTVPVYIAECAPEELRGAMVSLDVLLITTGQFVAYAVDALLIPVEHNWRWMLGLSAVPAILQFIGMIWMPESPRWLLEKGKRKKATEILTRMRGEEKALVEAEAICQSVEEEKELLGGRNRYLELLRIPALRHALFIGVMLQVFQQFCGINTVMYYSPTILQLSQDDNLSDEEADQQAIYSSMFVAAANMIMSFIAVFAIDKVGRKILLLISLTGITIALFVLAFGFYEPDYSFLVLTGLLMYIIAFAPGMGPVPWTVNSEIYPLYVRAGASSISSTANWVSNLIVSLTFLSLIDIIGEVYTFLLLALISVIAFIFVVFLVPETKGKSLEDIQHLFETRWLIVPCRGNPAPLHEPINKAI